MQIRTLLWLGTVFTVSAVVVAAGSIYVTAEDFNQSFRKHDMSRAIAKTVFERTLVMGDYLLHHELRARIQWEQRHAVLGRLLAGPGFIGAEIASQTMRANYRATSEIFPRLVKLFTASGAEEAPNQLSRNLEQRLAAQLLTTAQETVSAASGLARVSEKELAKSLRQVAWRVGILVACLMALLAGFLVLVSRRVVLPVQQLQQGIKFFGGGNFDARVEVRLGDEIGAVAEAFNEMARQLSSTISELTTAQDLLVRQERLAMLGTLSATVSHELRNPLGTIRISMITISDSTEGKELGLEGAIARIGRSIKRCDDIIDELLDYTRDTVLNRESTDVDEWLDGLLDEQEVPTGLSLGRDLTSGVEATFDQDRLRRAVINIFDNACQAVTENGDGADTEVVVATKVNGKRVEIQVTDGGPGISDDELTKVFEPLYSTRSFGVGLGLPVVQKIVEDHGGGVDISSEIGRGTRVTLWLPLAAPEQG
ncbi:HAMP domain-containing histidine kinase [bacterium AH-315-B06]|nr:HAMP domain-containing histidine kinase [bacterium AH-315-B06]